MTSVPYPRLRLPHPYPPEWPRRLDFVTPLGLQLSCGARDLELYHIVAETSVEAGIKPPSEDIPTEYGVLKVLPQPRDKLVYVKNTTLDPTDRGSRRLVSQKEILEDIVKAYNIKYVGDFPDIVIKDRGAVEKIPKAVEDLTELQGSDEIFCHQTSHGNFAKKYRRVLGVRILEDPYYFTRADLWTHRILPPGIHHPILKKLRSVLRTNTLWTDAAGWGGLGKDTITAIEKACIGRLVNLDLGMPARLVGAVDGASISGQVYHLLKHDCYIALEPV